MTDDELANMLACADRGGLDAAEWNALSVRTLVAEVKRLRQVIHYQATNIDALRAELDAECESNVAERERLREELDTARTIIADSVRAFDEITKERDRARDGVWMLSEMAEKAKLDRDSAAAAIAELQRTVATAVERLRSLDAGITRAAGETGIAEELREICAALDVVKGGDNASG